LLYDLSLRWLLAGVNWFHCCENHICCALSPSEAIVYIAVSEVVIPLPVGVSLGGGGYVNTTEMPESLFLYPFCTIISRMASLLPMDNFFQTTGYD
jgi:hypothetical protein